MDKLLNPDLWVTVPVLGPVVAWMLLLHHRVSGHETALERARTWSEKQTREQRIVGERLASLEATCKAMQQTLQNIERRLP